MQQSAAPHSIRYYCKDDAYWQQLDAQGPDDWGRRESQHHHARQRLLEQIHSRHGIPFDLFPVPSNPQGLPDEAAEHKIYREHFLSRTGLLKPRLEESVAKALRSRAGRGHLYVAGRIAILEGPAVAWCTGSASSYRRFLPPSQPEPFRPDDLFFLEAVLAQGSTLLHDLCFPVSGSPEEQLVARFRSSGVLRGVFRSGVWLASAKQVDLICECPDETWLLEAKTKLTWEALGQAIGYAHLFAKEHPHVNLRSGIVCMESDPAIEEASLAQSVTLFVEQHDGFARRG